MLLLVSSPDFKKAVSDAREKYNIPASGFETGTEYDIWMTAIASAYTRLTDSKKRIDSPFMQFLRTPRLITREYGLPDNFTKHVRQHMLFGTVSAPLNNFDIGPFPAEVPPNKITNFPVNIYATLTTEELQDLKKEQERMAKHLPKYQPLKNVGRKIQNEQKIAECDAYNESEDREYHLTLAELDRRNAPQIHADIRELKELRKKRFGK